MSVEFETDSRGFKRLKPIETSYGETISIKESSAAMRPMTWMIVNPEKSVCGQEKQDALMVHLSFDQIDTLIEQLQWIKENHYNA